MLTIKDKELNLESLIPLMLRSENDWNQVFTQVYTIRKNKLEISVEEMDTDCEYLCHLQVQPLDPICCCSERLANKLTNSTKEEHQIQEKLRKNGYLLRNISLSLKQCMKKKSSDSEHEMQYLEGKQNACTICYLHNIILLRID